MFGQKTVLVVEDNEINREILKSILATEYAVLEAENGLEAFEVIAKHGKKIAGIVLDIVMPIMDGYTFLEKIADMPEYRDIPIVVSTGAGDVENEKKSLKLGAWDFVSKPYDAELLMFRLKNAIERSQLSAFEKLKYLAEHDTLTGIYNKAKFLEMTHELINSGEAEQYAFVRFDIDHFQMINSFYGTATGDNLLKYIAEKLPRCLGDIQERTYGRMEADVFAFCIPYENEELLSARVEKCKEKLREFPLNYNIMVTFGIYLIQDRAEDTNSMLDKASLAAKQIKGNYIKDYAFYSERLSETLEKEQRIANEMVKALEEEQFEVYLQPKYNLHTNEPEGAEALVRWFHPEKGMVSPGDFIPVFERNGFIIMLDFYVWEKVCQLLRKWLDEGRDPSPVSVNVSRVNIYNPNFIESICELVDKYQIPNELLQLEITESAYTDNPQEMQKTIKKLQNEGFMILMDDFGSAYSSLNILKDIEMNILKVDMRFMEDTKNQGRSQNILASIVRMAKWLHLPVIAEGVEKQQQVEFLRGIGCEYVQGFYFARPMPVKEYEVLSRDKKAFIEEIKEEFCIEELWSSNRQLELLLSNVMQPVVIYEYSEGRMDIIRVNQAFYQMFGYHDQAAGGSNPLVVIEPEYRNGFKEAFKEVVSNRQTAECEYLRNLQNGEQKWILIKLKYIAHLSNRHIIFGTMLDITEQKRCEKKMEAYLHEETFNSHGDGLHTDNERLHDAAEGQSVYETGHGSDRKG